MFTEVFLNYNCMSLPHFRTLLNETHILNERNYIFEKILFAYICKPI